MRKITIIVGIVLLLLFIFSFLYGSGVLSVVSNEIVIGNDGNTYIEERCVDVSSFKASGYTLDSIDENGCEIVKKKVIASSVKVGQASDCTPGSFDTRRDLCQYRYGSSWDIYIKQGTNNICGGPFPSGSWGCVLYDYEYEGGTQRVVNICNYDQNDLLVAETFSGSQNIDAFDLRYPIKKLCLAHPSIVTDDFSKTSIASTDIPQSLANGESISIKSSETVTIFYVIENNADLPLICDSSKNLAYDIEKGVCTSTLGFAYLCSEGQFDALKGVCVVQPESNIHCEQGRYDVLSNTCIYNPPLQVDCEDERSYYSVRDDVCKQSPQKEYKCPESFIFEQPNNALECAESGGIWDECPQCDAGDICPESICKAECSKGQVCVFQQDVSLVCGNASEEINSKGECIVNGEIIKLCPDDTNWDKNLFACVKNAPTELVCEDGSKPIVDLVTQQKKCIFEPPTYIDCGNLEYDSEKNVCVASFDKITKQNYLFQIFFYLIIVLVAIIIVGGIVIWKKN